MWCALPVAAGITLADPVCAQTARFQFDIAAGPLNESIAAFTAQTGISVGMPGREPSRYVSRLHGRMTTEAAFDRLLKGTGLRARRLAAGVYRLEPVRDRARPPVVLDTLAAIQPLPDIVVTGRKQSETLSDVPAPLSVFVPDKVRLPDAATDTQEVVRRTAALATTNAGPGANQLFIRGVADSPFLGFGQSTVAVQIDDGRATYDGPDPDLRLVDVDRVEILKGPQGPLYGTGALGGVYRVVMRKPVLGAVSASGAVHGNAVDHGGYGGGGSAVLNLPIISDTFAIRAVGYGDYMPGWINDIDLASNSNWVRTLGGRVALRYAPVSGWTIDVQALGQKIRAGDSQYVFVDAQVMERSVRIREPSTSRFGMLAATIKGAVGKLDLTISGSIDRQRMHRVRDASAAQDAFSLPGPLTYNELRRYQVVDQEIRVESNAEHGFRWMAGLSYLNASSFGDGVIEDAQGALHNVLDMEREIAEAAIFGQIDFPLSDTISTSLGARLFHNEVRDDREADDGEVEDINFLGFSPSASLSWKPSDPLLVYFRYSSAIRPGGAAADTDAGRYDADELTSFDLGARFKSASGRLTLDAALYRSRWLYVQSDYLLPNGLVATRNAGDSRAIGIDLSLSWLPFDGWQLETALLLQRSRLENDGLNAARGRDLRMPVVPDESGHVRLEHQFDLARWQARAGVEGYFVGATRLSFDEELDRRTPAYGTLRTDFSVSRGPWRIGLVADNVLDIRGDSFAFGNSFSIFTERQYTPIRPRTLIFSIGYSH